MQIKMTKEQKQTLKKAESVFDTFVKDDGLQMTKWAFNKVLKGQTERQKLVKERAKIEARLKEIDKEI